MVECGRSCNGQWCCFAVHRHSPCGLAIGLLAQIPLPLSIPDSWGLAQTKGCLEVNVDTIRNICQGDDIDVVGWVLVSWLHSWCLHQTREALAIAVDSRIDPVTDWNSWSSVWVGGVNRPLLSRSSVGSNKERCCERRSRGRLNR